MPKFTPSSLDNKDTRHIQKMKSFIDIVPRRVPGARTQQTGLSVRYTANKSMRKRSDKSYTISTLQPPRRHEHAEKQENTIPRPAPAQPSLLRLPVCTLGPPSSICALQSGEGAERGAESEEAQLPRCLKIPLCVPIPKESSATRGLSDEQTLSPSSD